MKKLLLLLSIAFMAVNSQAQFVNYERDGGWNFGFNGGATWQPKEAFGTTNEFSKPYAGFGGGFTLGKALYEKEGAFLAFDLRGRYLGGMNYGWTGVPVTDSTITGDTTSLIFRNYKMKFNELSLEGVITLHRLRERTGIILYGFGGIGATNYRVESDLYDGAGIANTYDSSYIQSTANATAAQLKQDSDRGFETTLNDNRWSFVPSLGFGLGYQITPGFSIGLEHKITYDVLGDEFDGGILNNLVADGNVDKYHYTALNLRWNLLGRGEVYEPKPDYSNDNWTTKPPVNNNNNSDPVAQESKPLVNIYNPANNNLVVHSSAYTIKAKIYNVSSSNGVTFKQNGLITSGFTYNPSNNEFSAQVYLQPGNNSFEITGVNTAGSDKDSRIIIYKIPEDYTTAPAPIVSFSNPYNSSVTVSQPQFNIVASVLNVTGQSNITFVVNGVSSNNFNYNTSNKTLTASINLLEGNNSVTIKGVNSVGSDVETVNIKYVKPVTQKAPIVNFTKPNTNPYQTNSPVEVVSGTVQNVTLQSGVKVLVNGNNLTNFSFDPVTTIISFSTNLIVGANVVQITGTNAVGTDSKSTTIIYRVSEAMPLPVVDFTNPSISPYNTTASNINLTATVLNVTTKNYITVTFNGQNLTNFSYNSTTKEVTFNVNLVTGNNVFKITGTNSSGSDSDDQVVIKEMVQNQSPPIVNITNPNVNPYNTNLATQLINASIINVDNISGVNAKFNGSTISNFTFDPFSGKFAYQANLLVGANVLEITGTNAVGTASKSQTIIYTEADLPCENPSIIVDKSQALTKSTLGGNITMNTTNSKAGIAVTIVNATSIDFKINGQSSPGYNYNAATGEFESFLHLKEGANSYQIIAINDCGKESLNITYIYTSEVVPCDPPVINFINPGANPYTYSGPKTLSISTSILGVTSNSQVVCKINNSLVKKLFDPTTGVASANVTLKEGVNNFVVTATNDCGTISTDLVINYTAPIDPPTVDIFTPSPLPYKTTDANVSVKANVTNVANVGGIQVFLDGQSVSNFNFNSSTQQVSFNLNLAIGSHQIMVKATNPAGTAQDIAEIIIEEEISIKCDDPIIVMSEPQRLTKSTGNPTLSVTTEDNTGLIKGVFSNTTNVIFNVNGQNSSNFTFNPTSGAFSSTVALINGKNNFQIVAGNSCGTVTASQMVIIEYIPPAPPCEIPNISMITPRITQVTTNQSVQQVTVMVANITSQSQVFSKLNNAYINQSFDATTGVLTLNLNLVKGDNELVVMAKNECGSDEIVISINSSAAGNTSGAGSSGTGSGSSGTIGTDGNTNTGSSIGGGSANQGVPNSGSEGSGSGSNLDQQGTQNATDNQADILNNNYKNEIKKADALYNSKNYNAAYDAYFKALQLKPNESHPKQRIQLIEKVKQEEEAKQKNENSYNDQIKKGDLYFKAGKYSTAKTYYTKALGYKPTSSYAKGKLAEVEKKLSFKPTITKPSITKPAVTKPTVTPKVTTPAVTKPTVTPKVIKPKVTTKPAKKEVTPTNIETPTPEAIPTSVKRGG